MIIKGSLNEFVCIPSSSLSPSSSSSSTIAGSACGALTGIADAASACSTFGAVEATHLTESSTGAAEETTCSTVGAGDASCFGMTSIRSTEYENLCQSCV